MSRESVTSSLLNSKGGGSKNYGLNEGRIPLKNNDAVKNKKQIVELPRDQSGDDSVMFDD